LILLQPAANVGQGGRTHWRAGSPEPLVVPLAVLSGLRDVLTSHLALLTSWPAACRGEAWRCRHGRDWRRPLCSGGTRGRRSSAALLSQPVLHTYVHPAHSAVDPVPHARRGLDLSRGGGAPARAYGVASGARS